MMLRFCKTTETQRHSGFKAKGILCVSVYPRLVIVLSGCADLPRDQHGATARIQESKVLVAGISRESDKPSFLEEREKRPVEEMARRLGARVEWRNGNAHALFQDLEELKVPLVAAVLLSDSPFADRIGLSQPYLKDGPGHKDYCLAVAPGENYMGLLVGRCAGCAHYLRRHHARWLAQRRQKPFRCDGSPSGCSRNGREDPIVADVHRTLRALLFVADEKTLIREHGRYLYAEIFIQPNDQIPPVTEASRLVREAVLPLDWRLQHIVVEFTDNLKDSANVLTREELEIEST